MILIKNAEVYAPEYLGKKDVLLSYDRVLYIGDDIKTDLPDVEVIDASGMKLVPGFIDQHVHVIGGGGEQGLHSRTPELTFSDAVKAGVTTLVGLMGTDNLTRSVESLVAKTKALNNEGITAYCLTSTYQYPPDTLTGHVGKDMVYISEMIGCKIAFSDNRGSHPTKDELVRLASEVRVASLVSGKPGILTVHIGADTAGIEPIFDILETTDIPAKHFRPTHMARHAAQAARLTEMGGYADFTTRAGFAAEFAKIIDMSNKEFLTLSSDSNGSAPIWDEKHERIIGMGIGRMTTLYGTVKELVTECNLPLADALTYITSNVARALEIYPRKGTVTVGGDADIVLLDKDLNVDTVIAKGRKMMTGKDVLVKGMYE
jgi:beta-aspartyl-dipeptidase (metallo-type)